MHLPTGRRPHRRRCGRPTRISHVALLCLHLAVRRHKLTDPHGLQVKVFNNYLGVGIDSWCCLEFHRVSADVGLKGAAVLRNKGYRQGVVGFSCNGGRLGTGCYLNPRLHGYDSYIAAVWKMHITVPACGLTSAAAGALPWLVQVSAGQQGLVHGASHRHKCWVALASRLTLGSIAACGFTPACFCLWTCSRRAWERATFLPAHAWTCRID